MTSVEPLDIKVVYAASKRGGYRPRAARSTAGRTASLTFFVGVLSVVVAGTLHYATWWRADPKLRVMLFLRTPLPGVNLDDAASALIPAENNPKAKSEGRRPAPSTADVEAQKTEAKLLVATVAGWVILATLAAAAMGVLGGASIGRSVSPAKRVWLCVLGLILVAFVAWSIYALRGPEGRFIPKQLRFSMLGGLIVVTIVSLIIGRGVRPLCYVAGVLLIVSAAGSCAALHLAAHYELIKPGELPLQLVPLSVAVFIAQSLWGWALLPIGSRLRTS